MAVILTYIHIDKIFHQRFYLRTRLALSCLCRIVHINICNVHCFCNFFYFISNVYLHLCKFRCTTFLACVHEIPQNIHTYIHTATVSRTISLFYKTSAGSLHAARINVVPVRLFTQFIILYYLECSAYSVDCVFL